MVYIRRKQYSFAMAGSTDVPQEKQSQFNRRSYFIILAVLLGIAMLVFAVEIIFSIAVPVRDIAGALVSSVILAYIIHLLNAFRKE
jgi:vacuolar-type H+-ATPase subunit I/STV1